MLKEVTEKQYTILLEELNKGTIPTTKEFYKLLDVNKERRKAIIEILEQVKENDREKVFEKILSFGKINKLSSIITSYPVYVTTEERLEFLMNNIANVYLSSIANILQFDFLFKDKLLVEKILEKTKTQFSFALQIQMDNVASQIKENQEEFETGERNVFIEKSFDFTNPKYMEDILKLSDVKTLGEEPTCLDDIIYYCNTEEDVSIFPSIWRELDNQKRLKTITTMMTEIHEKATDTEDLDRKICNMIRNINSLTPATTYTDEQFKHLANNIQEDQHEFNFFYQHFDDITDPNSPCYVESSTYKTIRSIANKGIRAILLDAFTTSLAPFITLDKLIKISSCDKKEAEKQLKDLALENKCLDYLQAHTDIDINTRYFDDAFISYISQENLTKEQLLAMKGIIISSPDVFDGEKMVVNIPLEKQEGRVIKIGGISTNGKHE